MAQRTGNGGVEISVNMDTSGVKQGGSEVSSQMQRMKNSIARTEREIVSLQSQMKELGNTKIHTEEYTKLENAWNSLAKKRDALQMQQQSLVNPDGTASSIAAYNKLGTKIDDIQARMDNLRAKLLEVDATEKTTSGTQSTKYAQLSQQLSDANSKLQIQKQQLEEIESKQGSSTAGSGAKTGINAATQATKLFKKELDGIKSASKRAFGSVASQSKLLTSSISKITGFLRSSLRKIKNMILKAFIFSQILKGIQSVRDKLQTAIRANNELATSLAYIKGNLNTAFAGIYSAVLPALTALLSVVRQVTAQIAAFVALITGKSIKANQDLAKSLDKTASSAGGAGSAAKEAKKQLAGFDDMEILQQDDSSSGGGGGGSADETIKPLYEDIDTSKVDDMIKKIKDAWAKADFTGIGIDIGRKINKSLSNIDWATIQATSGKLGKSLATLLNGSMYGTDFNLLGSTIGNGINTAIEFAYQLVSNFDYGKFGIKVGELLESTFATIDWAKLGQTMGKGADGAFNTLYQFVNSFDFSIIGKSLSTLVNNFFSSINWTRAGGAVIGGFNGIVTTLDSFISGLDGNNIGKSIAKFLSTAIQGIDWSKLGKLLFDSFKLSFDVMEGFIQSFDFVGTARSIISGIGDAISQIDPNYIALAIFEIFTAGLFIVPELILGILSGLSDIFADIFKALGMDSVAGFFEGLADDLNNIGKDIQDLFNGVVEVVKEALGIHSPSTVFAEIGSYVVQGFINGINKLIGKVIDVFKNMTDSVKTKITTGFTTIKTFLSTTMTNIKNDISTVWNTIKTTITTIVNAIKTTISTIWNGIKTTIGTVVTNIKTNVSTGFGNIKEKISTTLSSAKQTVSEIWDKIKSIFSDTIDSIKSGVSEKFEDVKKSITSTIQDAKDNVDTTIGKIKETIEGLPKTVGDTVQKVKDKFSDVGDAIGSAIGDTVKSAMNKVFSKIESTVNSFIGKINGVIGVINGLPGVSISKLNDISLPRLASGTVVPANYGEFAAILGDNKRETEVVSPLSTMKQALKEALMETGGLNTNGGTITVQCVLDGRTIYEEVVKRNQRNTRATGTNRMNLI